MRLRGNHVENPVRVSNPKNYLIGASAPPTDDAYLLENGNEYELEGSINVYLLES